MSYLKIVLNTKDGDEIKIDEDELDKVLFAIKKREIVVLKQGIFNTAYFVAILPDINRSLSGNTKSLNNLFDKIKKLN